MNKGVAMKQTEIAKKLSVTQSYISKIFNGKKIPGRLRAEVWRQITGWSYAKWQRATVAQVQRMFNRIGG